MFFDLLLTPECLIPVEWIKSINGYARFPSKRNANRNSWIPFEKSSWHEADWMILAHTVCAVQERILWARGGVDHDHLYLTAFMYLARLIASWRNSGFPLLSQILLWRYGERFLNEILILRSRFSGYFSAYFHSSLLQGHLARDWFLKYKLSPWLHVLFL